ncbi:uncharacterized protein LOC114729679 [Neltuma alba]|uniref:uncharacterized protein LOC114729679 n=1 Tax=Neltuma alba TaxID=207710 RepID=UPI0010A59FE7|nr:uncharacterized protein LOC114729679 [Prosopis alba]
MARDTEDGKFVEKDNGEVKYCGGTVRVRVINEGTKLEDLRAMIGEWFSMDCHGCDIKYTLSFDERVLVDLIDDGEVDNLFEYNDRNAHIYIAHKGNDNVEEGMGYPEMISRMEGLSEQSDEPTLEGNALESTSSGGSERPNVSLPYGVVSAPTPLPEMNSLKWKELLLGRNQTFANAEDFKKKVHKFSIANKFEYKYVKNCRGKMYVKCSVEGCPWRISARVGRKSTPFLRVATFINEHVHNAQDNLCVEHCGSASLTASIIRDEVNDHIDRRPNDIRKTLERDYGMKLTYKQAYRAKQKALEDIHGRPDQSYMLIPWICERLKETDNKTVAKWVANTNNTFERAFIAYGCCIEGFIAGARHVLYIDGCHLSGPYKGTLLSASAYDADNELLPFAIAVVKGETLEDWTWFLYMIKEIVGSMELTIVSDRHNAIIGAVQAIFGGERHAYCYRHVKENFSAQMIKLNRGKRKTSGKAREEGLQYLDAIAYARLDTEFDGAMDNMRKFNPQLFEWLLNHGDVERWALSKFPFKRWDNITTNLAESFNAWMLKERRYNVAQLIHEHREKVAKKMYAASIAMSNWKNSVGPNIDAKLVDNVARSACMLSVPYGGGRVCVHTAKGAVHVDLGLGECTCAAWQMSGIPCPHACAAIKAVNCNVYDFVDECYKITSQQKIYGRSMIPVATVDMPNPNNYWVENIGSQVFLAPPLTNRPPGRPKVKRRESQFQNRKIYHCSTCKQVGHTRRTCKNPNPS